MTFLDFKNLLLDSNIKLFDAEFRIVHYRFNELNKNMLQNGGAFNKYKPNELIERIKQTKPTLLEPFINGLLTNNNNKIFWIINMIK
jgi:hypothetical protein